MRHVAAICVALMMLPALSSTVAQPTTYDECLGLTADQPCLTVTVPDDTPEQLGLRTIYVYLGSIMCDVSDDDCMGRDGTSDGRTPPMDFMGVLYEETNGVGGLNRYEIPTETGEIRLGDHMILL